MILMTSGCATQTKIITAKCPTPPDIQRPDSYVQQLTDNSNAGEVIQSHRLEIKSLQGYAEQLEKILDAYKEVK